MSTTVDGLLAVRASIAPVARTYGVLRGQQTRAGELAEEVDRLADLATSLLQQIGLAYLLEGDDPQIEPAHRQSSGPEALAASVAVAHVAWADFLNGLDSLACQWLARGDLREVRRLAACLDDLGELQKAEELRTEAKQWHRGLQLSNNMDEAQVRKVIRLFRSVLSAYPEQCKVIGGNLYQVYMSVFNMSDKYRGNKSTDIKIAVNNAHNALGGRYKDIVAVETVLANLEDVLDTYFGNAK